MDSCDTNHRKYLPFLERLLVYLFFIVIYLIVFDLFTKQAIQYHGKFASDLYAHISFAKRLADNPKYIFAVFEPGFHLLIILAVKLLGINYNIAASYILSLFYIISALLVFSLVKRELKLSDSFSFLICLALILVAPIYVPFFSKNFYLLFGSPNIWHNPTIIMVKPFAIYITFQIISGSRGRIDMRFCFIMFLLFISCLFKPSYAEIFIPSLIIYNFLAYIKNKTVNPFKYTILLILPAIILLCFQFVFWQHKDCGLMLTFFGVMRYYHNNPLFTFLRTMAFPIAVIIVVNKSISRYLYFCWIMLIIGYLNFAFIAEKGECFAKGNFVWGYSLALSLIFIFSMIDFLRWWLAPEFVNVKYKHLKLIFILFLFLWHLFTGIVYSYRIFYGYTYH